LKLYRKNPCQSADLQKDALGCIFSRVFRGSLEKSAHTLHAFAQRALARNEPRHLFPVAHNNNGLPRAAAERDKTLRVVPEIFKRHAFHT